MAPTTRREKESTLPQGEEAREEDKEERREAEETDESSGVGQLSEGKDEGRGNDAADAADAERGREEAAE